MDILMTKVRSKRWYFIGSEVFKSSRKLQTRICGCVWLVNWKLTLHQKLLSRMHIHQHMVRTFFFFFNPIVINLYKYIYSVWKFHKNRKQNWTVFQLIFSFFSIWFREVFKLGGVYKIEKKNNKKSKTVPICWDT